MLMAIYLIKDDDVAKKVCAAWLISNNIDEIICITKMEPGKVQKEIERLTKMGILLPERKLDDDVERYLTTIVAAEIKSVKEGA